MIGGGGVIVVELGVVGVVGDVEVLVDDVEVLVDVEAFVVVPLGVDEVADGVDVADVDVADVEVADVEVADGVVEVLVDVDVAPVAVDSGADGVDVGLQPASASATRTAGKNPVRAFIIHSQFDQNLGLDIVVSKDTSH